MEPKEREQLALFLESLPVHVQNALAEKNVNAFIVLHELCAEYGFALYEMGNICQGVLRVLAGEDSPANLVSFIQKDPNIEDDNRPKIPALAYEIQTKIFDPVLPILKQAGMPVKEGRVAPAVPVAQPTGPIGQIGPRGQIRPIGQTEQPPRVAPFGKGDRGGDESSASVPRPDVQVPRPHGPPLAGGRESRFSVPLDEKHLRALLRIAAGTEYTEERLREAFEDLPPGLRQAITSVDTANAVQEIAKKYLLHVDQMAALASETGLVLLGQTHPRDFVKNLASRLRISEAQALPIAREISGQVLGKVREALRGLHEETRPRLPTINYQLPTTPAPPKKLDLLAAQAEVSPEKLPTTPPANRRAGNYQLPTGSTPYSPDAQWNLEAARDIHERGEKLNRDELLRSIERPAANSQQPTVVPEPVGPTGWRPPEQQLAAYYRQPTTAQSRTVSAPKPPIPPAPPEKEPEDFISQKLSAPVSLPRAEKRYTTDPYREPFE